MKHKIYLAGPDVFRENAVEHLEGLKKMASRYGFIGLAPLDNIIDVSDKDKFTPVHSRLIFNANVELIKQCDVIIANITPFRGACIDDGTAWEIGYAFALGKKVYGYTVYNNDLLANVTQEMWDMEDHNFEGGTNSEYTIVENFGHPVNLMIIDSIKSSGGSIYSSYEECLIDLAASAVKDDEKVEEFYHDVLEAEKHLMDDYYDKFGEDSDSEDEFRDLK